MKPLHDLQHPALTRFLQAPGTLIDPRPYMVDGGGGTEALIRDYLIKAWQAGYQEGLVDSKARMLKAIDKIR